jgi:hypothetical protein
VGDRYYRTDNVLMNPNQPPEWSMRNVTPPTDGTHPPAEPPSMNLSLTEPDAAGHQWMLVTMFDGTISTTMRMPWQVVPAILTQAAQLATNLAGQAQAKAGPSLIVPPAGAKLPDLGINGNGNGRGR